MANSNEPTDAATGRFRFLLHVFNWSRQALRWILAANDRDTRLPLWERCFASGSGLAVLAGLLVGPGWFYSPNAMFAFADVIAKFPMMIGLPIIGIFGFCTGVFASLQPLGAFSEHFLRGFLLLPFMIIPLYVLLTILAMVLGILRLLMIPILSL